MRVFLSFAFSLSHSLRLFCFDSFFFFLPFLRFVLLTFRRDWDVRLFSLSFVGIDVFLKCSKSNAIVEDAHWFAMGNRLRISSSSTLSCCFLFFLSSRRKRRNEDKEHKKNFPLLSWVEWQNSYSGRRSLGQKETEIGTTTKNKSKRFGQTKRGDIFFLLFILCGGSGRVYQIWPRSDTATLIFSVCLAIVLLLSSSSICREQVKRWKWK